MGGRAEQRRREEESEAKGFLSVLKALGVFPWRLGVLAVQKLKAQSSRKFSNSKLQTRPMLALHSHSVSLDLEFSTLRFSGI